MKPRNRGKSREPLTCKSVTRRRCLSLIAGCASMPMMARSSGAARAGGQIKKITWAGQALGADAAITLYADDLPHARKTLARMLAEIKKLEHYFSLFRNTSLINQLNNSGSLTNPPGAFHDLLTQALQFAKKTHGRFDPTVQPLFEAFKNCAGNRIPRPWVDDPHVIEARRLIGWRDVICAPSQITFGKAHMGITLNGIAQGFITDRATGILRAAGFDQTLVNFGEFHGLNPAPGRYGWRIRLGMAAEDAPARPVWTLKNSALAASSNSGFVFDEAQNLHHMLDPRSGTSAGLWREIYVEAPSATLADAASTALFATPENEVAGQFRRLKLTRALLIARDGSHHSL